MTSLRYLRLSIFVVVHPHNAWEHIPIILDNITSCVIDHVHFILYDALPERDHWVRIPSIITKPNFKNLRQLELAFGGGEMNGWKLWISRQLRGFEPRDVLHVLWHRRRLNYEELWN
jgi:hypothetical protein